jgi:hypothetical protein
MLESRLTLSLGFARGVLDKLEIELRAHFDKLLSYSIGLGFVRIVSVKLTLGWVETNPSANISI